MSKSFYHERYCLAESSRLCNKAKLAVKFVEERSEAIVQEQLIANERPVGNRTICPLSLQFDDSQIKQFENGIVVRKRAALSHLAETVV